MMLAVKNWERLDRLRADLQIQPANSHCRYDTATTNPTALSARVQD